jgi:prephenate dehydratase
MVRRQATCINLVINKTVTTIDPNTQVIVGTSIEYCITDSDGLIASGIGGNNVNLLKWESYIPSGKSSQAKFFISIEGHPSQHNVGLALEEVGFFSNF